MNLLNDEHSRIKNIEAGFMIAIAIFADALQALTKLLHFIPFAGNLMAVISGWFISFCAGFGFTLWFKLKKINILDKKAAIRMSSMLIEIIPILNVLPGWTIYVSNVIAYTRTMDLKKAAEKMVSQKMAFKKITRKNRRQMATQGA